LQPSEERKKKDYHYISYTATRNKLVLTLFLQNNLSFLSAGNSRIHNNKRLNNVQQDLNYMCHNDGCFTHRQESTN